jgi:CHAT domain-containing protein
MATATEIELHAHGVMDLERFDASYVVLSPDAGGRYALTAHDVWQQRLERSPLVILGACGVARPAPWRHASWSLPVAFRHAGARAVLASPSPIADAEAAALFAAVRSRLRAGASVAAAVRDARMERLAANPESSARDLVVFE